MADIFTKSDAQKLLQNKNIWFFGDSNMRGMYKDLIWLLEKNTLIHLSSLRGKLEGNFMNDTLIKGGSLHRGRNFQEARLYKNFNITMEFIFLTQCFAKEIQQKLKDVVSKKKVPDIIILNSCLWDITRWGPESVEKYKLNIINLLKLLKLSLPSTTRVIWTTTPPISHNPRGGFFIKQIEFLRHTLRFDVMEANAFVSAAVVLHGFDVLDIHYHLLLQIHRRRPDGIHWSPEAMRHITNLILTHICLSWKLPLPGNFKSPLLKNVQPASFTVKPISLQPQNTQLPACTDIIVKNQNPPQKSKKRKNKKNKSKKNKGKKRDCNGNIIGCTMKIDFTEDDFQYDYKKKRFKTAYC